jgi:hypothetical protein
MSKKLDITGITNELSEGSAFFRTAPKPAEPPLPSPTPAPMREAPRAKPLPDHKPTKPQARAQARTFIKRTFDLFEDQLNYLTRESLQDRLAGKEVSMNAMVREALDEWIKKREAAK